MKKTMKLLEQVVAIKKKMFKKNHSDRLTSQHELAETYQTNEQIKKTIKLLEQIVAIRKKVLKKDYLFRLTSQRTLLKLHAQQRCEKKNQREINA